MTYYDTSYPPSLWAPEPPPPQNPTGATPGAPGTFTPAGSTIPADLASLNALGPLGQTTAWVGGTYVVLGDASHAYWNGTTWANGNAPVEEPASEPESVPEPIPDEEPSA